MSVVKPVNSNCPLLPDCTVRTGEPGGPVRVTSAPSSTAPFLSITVPDKLAVLDCGESLSSWRAIACGRGASGRLAKSTVQPSLFGLGASRGGSLPALGDFGCWGSWSAALERSTVVPTFKLVNGSLTVVSFRSGSWAWATPTSIVRASNTTTMKIRLLLNGSFRSFFRLHIGWGEFANLLAHFPGWIPPTTSADACQESLPATLSERGVMDFSFLTFRSERFRADRWHFARGE